MADEGKKKKEKKPFNPIKPDAAERVAERIIKGISKLGKKISERPTKEDRAQKKADKERLKELRLEEKAKMRDEALKKQREAQWEAERFKELRKASPQAVKKAAIMKEQLREQEFYKKLDERTGRIEGQPLTGKAQKYYLKKSMRHEYKKAKKKRPSLSKKLGPAIIGGLLKRRQKKKKEEEAATKALEWERQERAKAEGREYKTLGTPPVKEGLARRIWKKGLTNVALERLKKRKPKLSREEIRKRALERFKEEKTPREITHEISLTNEQRDELFKFIDEEVKNELGSFTHICPMCGRVINTTASECPHCKANLK